MLQRTEQAKGLSYNSDEGPRLSAAGPRGMDVHDIFAFLKSFWRIIAGWTIVAVTVALAYVFTATPLYTATADLRLDSRKIQVAKNNEQVVGDNSLDSAQLESEVEVLRSDSIALAVVKDLKLTDDPEFVDTKPGLFSLIFGGTSSPLSDDVRQRIAVGSLKGNLAIRRVGLTYVVEVSFRSPEREKAARIANAVSQAYVTDQLSNKYESARRASEWLQERITELRNQSNTAERAVEQYKEKNNIVDTGARGLLSDLQVQELNSQMITATAAMAEAKARLDRIDQVLKSPAPGEALGTVTDTLHNDVITKLRQRYLEDREHAARWTEKFGPTHLAVINMQQEMKEVQKSIVDELQRIAQTYKSDYEIAKAREESLRESLGKQVRESGSSGRAQVDLKELQSASQTYHTIFENFLQKYTQAVQEQSFPISDARVITLATPPFGKSWPKTTLIALLGLLVGLGGGLGHSLVLRNSDRTLRRPRDVEERFRLECIGLLPLIAAAEPPKKQLGEVTSNSEGDLPNKILGNVPRLLAAGRPVASSKPRARLDLTHKVANDPFSHFSERVRSVKIALDSVAQIRPLQCIGVISALPGEGKSTVAVNLANVLARGGRSTLLIDADLRNPQLTRRLGRDAKCGLLELMAGSVQLTEATRMVSDSTLCFLPVVMRRPISNSGDLLASERMHAVLTAARHGFDHVIIDLPPLGPISDSRAISPLVDSFILVVNWGRTRCEVVEEALANFGTAADKIVGVVLNRVDFRELDAHSHGYYYNKQYARYGYVHSKG
jgi:polysaccharide biosynthesis transport protein